MTARAFEFTLVQLQPRRNDAGPAAKQWKEGVQRWTWWMDHEPDCLVKSCKITMTSKQHVWFCMVLHNFEYFARLCRAIFGNWNLSCEVGKNCVEVCRSLLKLQIYDDQWSFTFFHTSPADLGKPKTSPSNWYQLIIAWSLAELCPGNR